MMKYKRLTTKGEDGNWQVWEDDYSHPFEALQVAIDRLAELEDEIEQGTLIELKDRKALMWGKDGDTVHCQHCGADLMGVFDGETEVIQCPKCGGFVYGFIAEDYNEAKLKEVQE